MGKSLNDNPFNSLGFNINGIGISQEAIEENKKALGQVSDNEVKEVSSEEELKESVNDYLKESLKSISNVSDEEQDLLKQLLNNAQEEVRRKKEEDKQINLQLIRDMEIKKEVAKYKEEDKKPKTISDTPSKERTTKKTYIIKDEYIEIIEGLHLLKDMEIKEVVNQLLGKAINDLGEDTINKAKKSYKDKNKKSNDLF